MLSIKDLHVSVEDKAILRGLSLDVRPGEVHAIMGPNGSGKSTLSATLAGREDYEVTGGTVEFKGKDLLALSPEDRAGEGRGSWRRQCRAGYRSACRPGQTEQPCTWGKHVPFVGIISAAGGQNRS